MKLVSRAKLAMLGGALAAATLAGLTVTAPWAHAASSQLGPAVRAKAASAVTLTPASEPMGPSAVLECPACTIPLRLPFLAIVPRQSCRELIIAGGNFTVGGYVDISLRDGVHYLTTDRVTAVNEGYYPGWAEWNYVLPAPGTGHHYLAVAYDEASGGRASATGQC